MIGSSTIISTEAALCLSKYKGDFVANQSPTHPSLGKDAHRVLNAADTRSLELHIGRWVNEGGAGGDEELCRILGDEAIRRRGLPALP
jgi:hypothetical protein